VTYQAELSSLALNQALGMSSDADHERTCNLTWRCWLPEPPRRCWPLARDRLTCSLVCSVRPGRAAGWWDGRVAWAGR